MFTFSMRSGVRTLVSLVVGGLVISLGAAQETPPKQPTGDASKPQGNQVFRVLPGDNVNKAAKNAAMQAQAYAAESAYRQGFNPYQVSNTMTSSSYGGGGGGYYGNPYYGGGYMYGGGGALSGSADVIQAQSQMMIANQQAVLMQQAVRREKLDQKRRVFDEWLYERANTPSLEDIRQEEQALKLRRSRNDPPITEILTGQALNSLLNNLQTMQAKGVNGPQVPLDEDVLKKINVTSAQDGRNYGLLRNDGNLSWPFALRALPPQGDSDAVRKEVQTLVKEAMTQAKNGRVDAGILAQLYDDVNKLRAMLKRNVGDLSFSQYNESKRYLNDLEEALKVLERADASSYVNGKFSAKGQNVKELVDYMKKNGLTFAPAVAGDEAAYVALQRAMAQYDISSTAMVSDR